MPNCKSSLSSEIRSIHRVFRKLAESFARIAPLLG